MKQKLSWTDISQVDIQQVNQAISDDYDKLNAKNAVKAIRGLEQLELLVVSIHEFNTKRRKTVLRVVHSKLLKSPKALALFNDYDRLNAQDTTKAIRDLGPHELLIFMMYECNTKRRKTVLRAVYNQLLKSPEALALKEKYEHEAQEGFTILQVGQTGVGKSETINSLFGETVAETNKFRPQTKSVTPFQGSYHNVKYTIYDTPGLGEWKNGNLKDDAEYLSLMKEQCRLPDVLWYVLRLDDKRVTEADANVLNLIRKNFGDAIWDRTMIVFTHSDMLKTTEEFQESLVERTQTVNEVIAQITNGKVDGVPAVPVANGHKHTLDGKSWLGELFTTTFDRVNLEHQNAFFYAFADDLKLNEPQSLVTEVQLPIARISEQATKKVEVFEKRIILTQEQEDLVEEKSVDVFSVLSKARLGAEIGVLIEGVTGGATMGTSIIIGALIGGMAGLYEWSRDE